jgi:hypothetical protein
VIDVAVSPAATGDVQTPETGVKAQISTRTKIRRCRELATSFMVSAGIASSAPELTVFAEILALEKHVVKFF